MEKTIEKNKKINSIYLILLFITFILSTVSMLIRKDYNTDMFVIIASSACYTAFQIIFLKLLNKLAISDYEKVSFYVKSFIIIIVSAMYLSGLINNIKYLSSFVGVNLIIDVVVQSIKMIIFKNKLVSLEEIQDKGVFLSTKEVEETIKSFNPDYTYFYKKVKKEKIRAIDKDTFKRLQDIYIAKKLVVGSRINLCKFHAYRKR